MEARRRCRVLLVCGVACVVSMAHAQTGGGLAQPPGVVPAPNVTGLPPDYVKRIRTPNDEQLLANHINDVLVDHALRTRDLIYIRDLRVGETWPVAVNHQAAQALASVNAGEAVEFLIEHVEWKEPAFFSGFIPLHEYPNLWALVKCGINAVGPMARSLSRAEPARSDEHINYCAFALMQIFGADETGRKRAAAAIGLYTSEPEPANIVRLKAALNRLPSPSGSRP